MPQEYFLIHAVESSAVPAGAPHSTLLRQVFADTDAATDGFVFLGPPRIVRRGGISTGNAETHVATLLRFTPGNIPQTAESTERKRGILRGDLLRNLSRIERTEGDWGAVEVLDYNPALHGPAGFWESGQASRTRTQDEWPDLTLTSTENPVGPDDPAQRTQGVSNILDDAAKEAPGTIGGGLGSPGSWMQNFKGVGYAAVAVLGLYLAIQVVPIVKKATKSNPSGQKPRGYFR